MEPQLIPLLDPTIVNEIRALQMDGVDVVGELVSIFLVDSQKLVEQMHQSNPEQDIESIQQAAHRLKGLGGSLGASRLSEICGAIEMSIHQADTTNLGAYLIQLEIVYMDTRAAFLDHLNRQW